MMEQSSIGSTKRTGNVEPPKPPPKPKKENSSAIEHLVDVEEHQPKNIPVKPKLPPKPNLVLKTKEIDISRQPSTSHAATSLKPSASPYRPIRKVSPAIANLAGAINLNEASPGMTIDTGSPKTPRTPGSILKSSLFETFSSSDHIESTHILNFIPNAMTNANPSQEKSNYEEGDHVYEEIMIPPTHNVKFVDDFAEPGIDYDSFESDFEYEYDVVEEVKPIPVREVVQIKRISQTSLEMSISTQTKFIVAELLENERCYCQTLQAGINNYIVPFDRLVPSKLRGNKNHIFGNLEKIFNFHSQVFLPSLRKCGDDLEAIAKVFKTNIQHDHFYCYVTYSTNHKRAEKLVRSYDDFWKEVQEKCGDRLGIQSFLLQPIQRLPRLLLLLNEVIKDLSKNLESTFKETIAAFCSAEKSMKSLLETVNNSMSINDIKNCNDIDVSCQGKFRKMNEFEIFEYFSWRRFRGKVFFFDNCIIYTEATKADQMEYRGHFESNKLFFEFIEAQAKFKLSKDNRKSTQVKFKTSLSIILMWNDLIRKMLHKVASEEKKRLASDITKKNSMRNVRPIFVVRSEGINRVMRSSTFNSTGSSGSTSLDRASFESSESMDESSSRF